MLIIDPMHNLYIGTAKYIFNLWLKREIVSTSSLKVINDRILSLVVPSVVQFGRLPACMNQPSSLTAEQWMLWVNYYSLYCLYDLIAPEHFECWRHFVLASRLLCRWKLSDDEIRIADALLLQFCRRFETLYGQDVVTPNIHLHVHLADCIRDYGPMSSFWLFAFERFNGILGDEPTNNRSIEIQLMTRFLKDNAHLELLMSVPSASSDVTSIFSQAILDHVCNFTSIKHLDTTFHLCNNVAENEYIIPATKYTISCFPEMEIEVLSNTYHKLVPSLFNECENIYLPRSFQ